MSKSILILTVAAMLTACGDKTGGDTGGAATDGGATDGGATADAGTTAAIDCDTSNEDCAPGTCGGEGADMTPGSDCIACHSPGNYNEEGNAYWSVAGTVFSDIYGSNGASNVIVRVTDSTGKVVEMNTHSSGNFYSSDSVTPPLNAEVEVDGTVRAMVTPVKTGACNTCHTCAGASGGKMYTP